MSKIGRPSKKDQYKDQIYDLYYTQGWSLSQISREIGPAAGTISRWFKDWGWSQEDRVSGYNPNLNRTEEQKEEIRKKISETKLRQRNEGVSIGRPKAKREIRTCVREGCENTFEVKITDPKKYCSTRCNTSVMNESWGDFLERKYEEDPKRCPCGAPIPYEQRHSRKYCTASCRQVYGLPTAQSNPANHVEFICQNESCGKTVVRPKGYGYNKYCSNLCAQKHTRTKKHIVVDDSTVLDSKLEALVWGLFSLLGYRVERYDRSKGVEWSAGSWYAPDFLLTKDGESIALEAKGREDENDQERWQAFKDKVGPLWIITHDEMRNKLRSLKGEFSDLGTHI